MKLINFNPKLHLNDCLNQIYSNPKYPLQKLEKGLSITKFIPEFLCYPFIPIKSQVTGFKKQYNCLVQTYTLLRIIDNLVDRDFKDKNENILFLDKEALNIAKEDIF